ncbi:2-oxoglutarate dehydrogenase E1 component [Tuberibacillus sp. Marseille-P3662]|uniref:2-oxoglutarate dehydrogenase E1 component n=1 Tax=Tuberibacillus sp. Marseille-P3662 TaxID=1965358 RepID=UPI000A1CAE4C|nr:2-oxoglutarate dehydrogenase E1 component [Tuberibacillus sp. Marseille-P3662]
MSTGNFSGKKPWEEFYGPNLGYVADQYEQYKNDPDSVEAELRELFTNWGPPPATLSTGTEQPATSGDQQTDLNKVVAAVKLADNIRAYGHLNAQINPLGMDTAGSQTDKQLLNLDTYELTEEDLQAIPAKVIWEEAPNYLENGLDVINELREIYTKTLSFQFGHIPDGEEREWLNRIVESGTIKSALTNDERVALLKRLAEVEGFEDFLQRTFVGQKRFSIEGVDVLVPMLDEIFREGVKDGVGDLLIGMAHRGRLNVLAHILEKPYEKIFSEFHHSPNKELVPSEGSTGINYGWTGDVKYHLGADRSIEENDDARIRLTLANNPSHLEFVNPVVEGYTRAAQEDTDEAGYPQQDSGKSVAVVIHGDAAFPGEGIVSETLNLSRLRGYQTGGTVHIIANNLLGFTTDSRDSRSTRYASDLAKGFEIPIVHVNADDPEACLSAMYLAYKYRKLFNKDFLIDLVGYRRHGHNEMDDPAATQPELYDTIKKHPTVKTSYGQTLVSDGVISEDQFKAMDQDLHSQMQSVMDKVKADSGDDVEEMELPEPVAKGLPQIDTSVDFASLRQINENLLKWPDGFTVYSKLRRILERRKDSFADGGTVDWAHAETLAFATILADGLPIRLTGQDTERGTFAQRHVVLHDSKTGETYSPLHGIPEAKASFSIYNSPLSEASALGFEYGYNVFAPETLVLWEAQFGDFANAGQVIFDQFISAGRAKWGQKSSLVILLPHGYEGQGPEHSSARLERFLQSAAENNWTVANLTSSAQYFHILRRQAAIAGKDEARPLVLMTPKSLLRNPNVASSIESFSEGHFERVLEPNGTEEKTENIKRLILSSGKVGVDLEEQLNQSEDHFDWLHAARVEQLYPLPEKEIQDVINRYENLEEIVWLQEEPRNMGAWSYMESKIKGMSPEGVSVRYVGRPDRSSPATGEADIHKKEQERIVLDALKSL